MIDRKRIGIIFNFSKGWLGGIYYIINVVKTFNYLDESEKPEVFLFYDESCSGFLKEFDYPYLTTVRWQFSGLLQGYITSFLTGKNKFIFRMANEYNLNAVYPVRDQVISAAAHNHVKLVSWYADLQHKHFPKFFSRTKIFFREARIFFMLKNANDLIVSSQSVANDFRRFYKIREDLNIQIYRFTSIIDDFNFQSKEDLATKYNLPNRFFLISNQFHKHKNHRILLEALSILKSKDNEMHLVLTGKLPDNRNSPYIAELHKLIEENDLKRHISFLGVISRFDQLSLMHHCQAVIQPSLFEGWSTVIEDAISIQAPVIASNIDVNIEQLGNSGVFFSPDNPSELAELIEKFPKRQEPYKRIHEEYETRVRRGAKTLLNILVG